MARAGRAAYRAALVAAARRLTDGPQVGDRRRIVHNHALLATMHHIVSDGWSMGVLTGELSALYAAFSQGRDDPLPPLAVQYADYALWQRRWLEGEVLQRQAAYWKAALAGAPALLTLPLDHARPAEQSFAGASVEVRLGARLTRALKALSLRHGVTLHMTLLAGFAALLSRLSGQEEVVIGSPSANRGRGETEGLIGFFLNTLALRVDLSGAPTVAELLSRAKAASFGAQSNQDLPFEQVVEIVRPPRSLSHSAVFQAMFAWQNAPRGELALPGLTLSLLESEHAAAQFDLTLSLSEAGDGIAGSFTYATALFDSETIERWLGYWVRLLEGMAADETQAVERIALLSGAERQRVLVEWNATAAEYPADKCIHELFEAQARQRPAAVAVVHGDRQLTYGELNARANRLAHHLRGLGVKPDGRVAICVERGLEMVVGLLAILKAGVAYVPLDPAYPRERLAFMLEDSAPGALLTDAASRAAVADCGGDLPAIDLVADAALWAGRPESNPGRAGLTPGHLAYVIYTSGSTGKPKGVMVEHRNFTNLIHWHCAAFGLEPGMSSSAAAGFSFDASAWEIWPVLCAGGILAVPPTTAARDPQALTAWWEHQPLDVSFLPTPVAEFALARGSVNPHLQTLLTGGDRLRQLPEMLPFSLVNNYGPTETTVVATSGRLKPGASIVSIGRPISNTRIYILDGQGEPVPIGVAGELYIGGAGVARGYLNRPELTAERFVADPFAGKPGARMYRTGDLGRWLADGNIEFLGRNDFQVKIRGFRIELGEIEARLLEHAGVREAVVLAREDSAGDKRLVAYYTGGEELGAEALRAHLAASLPDYMVPAAYVRLDALPLTPNGKLDRKALPAPDGAAYASRRYEAPRGEVEETLARLWAELLKVERVGRHDNFFELGGHSLLAAQLVGALRQNGMEVSLRQLFAHPTIEGIAYQITLEDKGFLDLDLGVIPLRTRGDGIPLFLVHEVNGEMRYGHELMHHIDADIPIYGLTGEPPSQISLRTVQGMAARLVRAIRAVQPAGPYRIAGWSFGGTLAYEIAAQLTAEDERVEFLGLLDTYRKVSMTHLLQQDALPLHEFIKSMYHSQAIAGDFGTLVRKYQELALPEHFSVEEIHPYLFRYRVHVQAAHEYEAHPIPVPLHLFSALESQTDDASRGWGAVAPEGLSSRSRAIIGRW